jgi:hypothetical protein
MATVSPVVSVKTLDSLPSDVFELPRLRIVATTIVINVVAVALLTLAPWSNWRTGVGLNLFDNLLLLTFALRKRDALLGRFILFGLAVGFAELPADAWLVDYTRTLDYSIGGGPMIWRSPIWMPFAWEIVAVQFGCVGLWFCRRFGNATGLIGIGLLGAINIPYYEEMAKRIHWWQYSGCRMISNTPYYIIVGEFLIAIAFTLLATKLPRGSWQRVTVLGIVGGAAIFAAYAVAYGLADRPFRI